MNWRAFFLVNQLFIRMEQLLYLTFQNINKNKRKINYGKGPAKYRGNKET